MVSRFPDGSPVDLRTDEHIIATFNKPFTRDDLIGKLVAVIDNGVSSFSFTNAVPVTLGVYEDYQSGGLDEVVLSDPEDETEVYLRISGNNLIADPQVSLLFDIDYDQQHKKVWDINNAGYLLEMPDMILPGSPTKRYVEVATRNDSDALNFILRVNNTDDEDGYQPISNTAELDDEDVDSWYNDHAGASNWGGIVNLVRMIMLMEYDVQAEGLSIESVSQEIEIDGGMLNLFTDGSPAPRPQPVVPLQMTSRFPSGSPINRVDASERALIATFNKDVDVTDLVGKLKAVICLDSGTSYNATAVISGTFGLLIENVGIIGLEIEGRNLYVTTASFDYYIFDLDFDQQHKKVWDINDAGYLLEIPDMILPGSPTKRYVEVATSNDSDALYFNIRVNNLDDEDGYQPISDTAELDDEDVDSWFSDGTGSPNWAHIVSIIEKVILMEYDVQAEHLSINAETNEIEIDGGMLNLFTDGGTLNLLID